MYLMMILVQRLKFRYDKFNINVPVIFLKHYKSPKPKLKFEIYTKTRGFSDFSFKYPI